jgi:hypothetical protein
MRASEVMLPNTSILMRGQPWRHKFVQDPYLGNGEEQIWALFGDYSFDAIRVAPQDSHARSLRRVLHFLFREANAFTDIQYTDLCIGGDSNPTQHGFKCSWPDVVDRMCSHLRRIRKHLCVEDIVPVTSMDEGAACKWIFRGGVAAIHAPYSHTVGNMNPPIIRPSAEENTYVVSSPALSNNSPFAAQLRALTQLMPVVVLEETVRGSGMPVMQQTPYDPNGYRLGR